MTDELKVVRSVHYGGARVVRINSSTIASCVTFSTTVGHGETKLQMHEEDARDLMLALVDYFTEEREEGG